MKRGNAQYAVFGLAVALALTSSPAKPEESASYNTYFQGKYLTALLDYGSSKLGAPPALGGVLLALIVISPKMISAVKAGIANQPQRSANLALGSCAPAMGIIFPIILGIGVVTGKTVIMGAGPSDVGGAQAPPLFF